MKLTEQQLQELAKQLRCPDENGGKDVAGMMNVTNANIINKAIEALYILSGDNILEIGPGNGKHIKDILEITDINYSATDISEAMVTTIKEYYQDNNNVGVTLTDGEVLPYADNTFDKIFTVNTIYFWEAPEDYINEIKRVLRPGGLLCIGYIPERIMHSIPFAKYGFRLYSENQVQELLIQSGFSVTKEITEKELVASVDGRQIEREFVIISALKK